MNEPITWEKVEAFRNDPHIWNDMSYAQQLQMFEMVLSNHDYLERLTENLEAKLTDLRRAS